jgi:hypothetical protein
MPSKRKTRAPIKKPRSRVARCKSERTAFGVDDREQLFNDGLCGPIQEVSLKADLITTLRGILLDLDLDQFREEGHTIDLHSPEDLYQEVIGTMLTHDPVLTKAEVRVSGGGLHVILWFKDPVEFVTEADRQKWVAIVKAVQRLLPTDPNCSNITALTRPLGSVNGKNGAVVRQLYSGEPISVAEVIELYDTLAGRPFRTLTRILFGDERIRPCPICKIANSSLVALDFVGKCYGCGKIRLGQLYDCFLKQTPPDSPD